MSIEKELDEFDAAVKRVNMLHLVESLKKLGPEDRLEVFSHFCTECGRDCSAGSVCYCWNDE